MSDLKTKEEYQYFGGDGNGLNSFYDYLISIPEFYSTMKWYRYKNYMFVAKTQINRYFIRKFDTKIGEKEITKEKLLHTLKLLIRKEKISKIKKINIL